MTSKPHDISMRKVFLWSIIIASGLLTIYISLISLVSLWIGLENSSRPGFWVPITAGAILLIAVFYTFTRTTHSLLSHMEEDDSLIL